MTSSPGESAVPPSSPSVSEGRSAASEYWAGNLDPQNLERDSGDAPGLSLEDEIRFAWTPDVAAAHAWLTGAGSELVVDLGAGLGAHGFAFARRGSRVVCIDTSPERLASLMRRAHAAGCADAILPVAAAAEALPLRSGSLSGLFTRSVMIHTDLDRAAAEAARVLRPGGRAALVEPQPGNPFAWLYRRTLAPRAWREITRYFSVPEQELFLRRIGSGQVRPFFVLGFLAFVFQYAWPHHGLFNFALRVLGLVDHAMFKVLPPLRRLAWFGLIAAEKPPTES